MEVMEIYNRVKPWRVAGVVVVLAVAVVASVYGATTISGWSRPADAGAPPPAPPQQPASQEIPVRGRLVFPRRAVLTFETAGKVGEVLVREGDQVAPGQALVRLDDLTVSALRVTLAQAEFDRDAARQALQRAQKADFSEAPLQRAEHEAAVAQARKELDDAEKKLGDFRRDYQSNLAAALQKQADTEKALDDAITALGYIDRDQSQDLVNARKELADAETSLDGAIKDMADFDQNYQADLEAARVKRTSALNALRLAEDVLSDFYFSLGHIRQFSGFDDDVPHRGLEEMSRLQAAVAAAQASLEQAKGDLAHLEGNRPLLLQERQAAEAAALATLNAARDEVADLEAGISPSLEHQQRRAAAEAARAQLAQAEMDLQQERIGPDLAELAVREKAVDLAREKLGDLEGPDPFEVAVKEAGVLAAQAKTDDARKKLEGATLRAPFAGVVSLVNVSVEDLVSDESRVLEVVDPAQVEVDGLVDATEVQRVSAGATARVSIASMPGEELVGTVLGVAEEPRTERGVVSYLVRIKVALPEDQAAPVRLSPVNVVIIHRGPGA